MERETLLSVRELDLIRWIASQTTLDDETVPVGPGDDCAVFLAAPGGPELLVTTDQVLDGVHIRCEMDGWQAAGRKAMARNLSDIAAMAGEPLVAVATVSLPRDLPEQAAREIYAGLREAGDAFGCPIIGGDVGTWDAALAVSATVIGRAREGGSILRSRARPGDALCVTGALGAAWKTDRHLRFTPRIAEARALADGCDLHAMIDLSDGLATDLRHVCKASGVGATIHADRVPIHPDVAGDNRLADALTDGEDYELLFALPGEQARRIVDDPPLAVPISWVGEVTESEEILLREPDGSCRPMSETGWEHGR